MSQLAKTPIDYGNQFAAAPVRKASPAPAPAPAPRAPAPLAAARGGSGLRPVAPQQGLKPRGKAEKTEAQEERAYLFRVGIVGGVLVGILAFLGAPTTPPIVASLPAPPKF